MQLNPSDPEYIEAMNFYLTGDWKSSEAAFTKLASRFPDTPFLFLLRGNTYYSMGRLDRSVEMYEQAIKLKPDFGSAFYKLGVCLYRLGKLQRALDSFRTVVEQGGQSHAMALYFIGLINVLLGKDDDAVGAFADFRKVSPESHIANFYLAQLRKKRHEFDKALTLLNELAEETPRFAEVHYMLGMTHYGLHNNTDAIKSFRRALDLNPNDQRCKTKLTLLTDIPWP